MTLLGVPLGYVLARGRIPCKQLLIGLVFLPMVVPGLAGGILLLLTFGPYGTVGGPLAAWKIALTSNPAGIVLAQLYVSSPFVVVSSLVAFTGVDPKLEIAAATLGDRLIMMHRGRVIHDFRGAEKRRLRPEDLLHRFEEVRRGELLDASAAEMLRRVYV